MEWLKKHAFEVRLASFALMVLVPVLLDAAANAGQPALIWLLLGIAAAVAGLLVLMD